MPVAITENDHEVARDVVSTATVAGLVPTIALAIARERERCAQALDDAQKHKAASIVRNC